MAEAHAKHHDYHLVDPSPWPIVGSISAFLMAFGAILWMHHMTAAAPFVFGLGVIGILRVVAWQKLGIYDYGEHWLLVALTVAAALVGVVTFGSVAGSMLPFILQRAGFDPASASAPFVATLVDVTGLMIYFSVALLILSGTLL